MNKIKVMIVEDDLDWIKALIDKLNYEEDMLVIATATNRKEAIKCAGNLDIDVILMDINLEGNKCDGIYAAAEIRQLNHAKIIMLTVLDETEIIINSFTAGAINYVSKKHYKEIPSIIRTALDPSNPIELLIEEYNRLQEEEQLAILSPSEKEVFKLIEKGCTSTEIENELHKSKSTLKNQINTIFKKLGTNTRKEAIEKIKMKGLYDNLKDL